MAIPNNLLNNAVLVNYWNLVRGDNKTVLTEKELYQCGVMVKMVDLIPPTGSAIYLIDGLSEKTVSGITYQPVPDFIDSSFANYVEKNGLC